MLQMNQTHLNTFHHIQNRVQYEAEHTLNVAHHLTCELVRGAEDASDDYNRINEAQISFP